MRTLRYWVAERLDDSRAYSLRARTRAEVLRFLREEGFTQRPDDIYGKVWTSAGGTTPSYVHPKQVTVRYADAFDLVCTVLGEGGVE